MEETFTVSVFTLPTGEVLLTPREMEMYNDRVKASLDELQKNISDIEEPFRGEEIITEEAEAQSATYKALKQDLRDKQAAAHAKHEANIAASTETEFTLKPYSYHDRIKARHAVRERDSETGETFIDDDMFMSELIANCVISRQVKTGDNPIEVLKSEQIRSLKSPVVKLLWFELQRRSEPTEEEMLFRGGSV